MEFLTRPWHIYCISNFLSPPPPFSSFFSKRPATAKICYNVTHSKKSFKKSRPWNRWLFVLNLLLFSLNKKFRTNRLSTFSICKFNLELFLLYRQSFFYFFIDIKQRYTNEMKANNVTKLFASNFVDKTNSCSITICCLRKTTWLFKMRMGKNAVAEIYRKTYENLHWFKTIGFEYFKYNFGRVGKLGDVLLPCQLVPPSPQFTCQITKFHYEAITHKKCSV